MDIHSFHESLQRFSVANSIDEIKELCNYFVAMFGFSAYVYALRIPSQLSESRLIIITTYPDEWIEHYFLNDYALSDPIMAHAQKFVVPIQWQDLSAEISKSGRKIMNEAGEFGLKSGITVPVHTPYGEMAVFSMALDRDTKYANDVTKHVLPFVHLLATYLHEAVRRVSDVVGPDDGKNHLSERERECLRWVADGKTSWEIAKLINVSERTVNFHLKNAAVKLDVFNRQHAVVKAVLKGLIHPRPF